MTIVVVIDTGHHSVLAAVIIFAGGDRPAWTWGEKEETFVRILQLNLLGLGIWMKATPFSIVLTHLCRHYSRPWVGSDRAYGVTLDHRWPLLLLGKDFRIQSAVAWERPGSRAHKYRTGGC